MGAYAQDLTKFYLSKSLTRQCYVTEIIWDKAFSNII